MCEATIFLLVYGVSWTLISVTGNQITSETDNREWCSNIVFEDDYWNRMWYLNSNISEVTLNVINAWEDCYNGTGIVIGVVDDGVFNHPDLNIDRNISADINSSIQASQSHGTKVAGVIAGKTNNLCGVGVAFAATIADIRTFTGYAIQSDEDFADMLVSHLNSIDIYSNSYTNTGNGRDIYPLDTFTMDNLQKGTNEGRFGKGAIYIFSTGNSGEIWESCAYDGYNNNIYTISVAGVQWNLQKLSTGENCSSIMVTSFTATGVGPTDYQRIFTTDGSGGCISSFGQNSAAVPMVSGAVALALQANENLGYRDIMYLLALTSRSSVLNQVYFNTNGAGYAFSEAFGFGLLDASALVNCAKLWKPVSERVQCTTILTVTPTNLKKVELYIQVSTCNVVTIEHLEVKINVSYNFAGYLQIFVTSPSGTKSNLVPGRPLDFRRTNLDISVVSLNFWGENPAGTWKWTPYDDQDESLTGGEIHHIQIIIHGTAKDPLLQQDSSCTNKTQGPEKAATSIGTQSTDISSEATTNTDIQSTTISSEGTTTQTETPTPQPENNTMVIIFAVAGGVIVIVIVIVAVSCRYKLRNQEQEAFKTYESQSRGNIVHTDQLDIQIVPSKSNYTDNFSRDNFMYGRKITKL